MSQSISFLKHNNAVPIAMFAIFGITTASFAANPEVRSAVYDSKQEVRQIDNTYIVSADVKSRDFRMQVTDVKEDTDTFYVTYAYKDISLVGHVWQEQDVTGSLTVSKKELEGRDLGLYIAKQLGEIVNSKRIFLSDVQERERKVGAKPKVVATTYTGIVGKFLDSDEEVFPGYVAVIEPKDSTYKNPVPADVPGDTQQVTGGNVSVSLPNVNSSHTQLTQAQIEQMVAEQVRVILAGSAGTQTTGTVTSDQSPVASDTNTASSTPGMVNSEQETVNGAATTTGTVSGVATTTSESAAPAPEPVVEPASEPVPPTATESSTSSPTE